MVATLVAAHAIVLHIDVRPMEHTLAVDHVQDTFPRRKPRVTQPQQLSDVRTHTSDLRTPENLIEGVEYDVVSNTYKIGVRMGDTYLNTPFLMTPEEYQAWSEKRVMQSYYRIKNDSNIAAKGKDEFRFTDMKFSLGPAEKIFGPGGIRVRTQGSLELKLGANMQSVDNPSLPINRRNTFGFDFDEKINLNLSGSVGDKMNMNLNYNTEATFDFDTRNIKLRYEGKEDEIIKLVEAGNVSLPTNSSLIRGASSLFGVRTDMQFGRLKLQAVASQKKTTSKTVSSRGGVNVQSFELSADEYEQNRHFFLSHFFRERYDAAMAQLPNLTSGVEISRIEVWVTNNTGTTTNTRNIIGLADLGEDTRISNPLWASSGTGAPSNSSNTLYNTLATSYSTARNIEQTTAVFDGIAGFNGGVDYEKMASARRLSSSEYTLNKALGYISLRTALQSDQVLAVAFEYTYRGQTYQVGEFSTDEDNASSALLVKALKNTSPAPSMPTWPLMMKNVYSIGAQNIQKERFKLDVKYLSDTTGVYLTYLNEPGLKGSPLIRLLGMDQLDANNNRHSDGLYDYIDGYTIDAATGRIIFNTIEPFGKTIASKVGAGLADRYAFTTLYDSLRTTAQQDAEHNKYKIVGQYRGSSANEIALGATNIPSGSVVVTAGGMKLVENTDYSVDYNIGVVTILNQSILDAGTAVSVSLESEADYSLQRKTMLGFNWEYLLHRDLTIGGTFMHLSEQALTSKVAMGSEALNNTLWGVNLSWKKKSQWLTDMVDKLPIVTATVPSHISLTAEYAQLIAGQNTGAQGKASYLDDFEHTNTKISISTPTEWVMSSTPRMFPEADASGQVRYGQNRALLSWYYIDPILTRRNSSLTPGHLRSDVAQQSNHYVREVYKRELFPKTQTTYGEPATLSVLNLAYYPSQRGPYNLETDLTPEGNLKNPELRWGGMMRKIDNTDFESSNIEYIEFWMLDPFIYTRDSIGNYSGNLYFNLGEISEDILKDGQKISEGDMPLTEDKSSMQQTLWGYSPLQKGVTYAFNAAAQSRVHQDVGYNGLRSVEEATHPTYATYLSQIRGVVNAAVYDSLAKDPAGDDYHYFRGSDYDAAQVSILDRYKRINFPEGNSVDSESSPERYSTSYKDRPDVEDINSDYTLNEYDQYFQYKVSIHPDSLVVGKNFIVDSRKAIVSLRNNQSEEVNWYLFRIPVDAYESKVGNIRDMSSVRFMRMFMTDFEKPVVLRMATLDLVRGEWRAYTKSLSPTASTPTGSIVSSSVSYEQNSGKTPVNYVLPPGISRVVDPSQRQLLQENESSLSMVVQGLNSNEARAVYKKTNIDLRNYKRLKMFAHLNALPEQVAVADNQVSLFVRLGSDYTNNYYEYEIPLTVTPEGNYREESLSARQQVWPDANNMDIPLALFTDIKRLRNQSKATGTASYAQPFSQYDPASPNNKVTVMGNPTLGEVRTMMIGVRNNSASVVDAEVWVNELRLEDQTNNGGWAAQGTLNVQLSDLATLNATGNYQTAGFGGLEDGIAARRQEDFWRYSINTNFELGRFVPPVLKLQAPVYYAYSRERQSPVYNPLDSDMKLKDALEALSGKAERDSLRNIVQTNITTSNFSISNARFNITSKRKPMPYDPANFTFGYAHSRNYSSGNTTVWENEEHWRWTFGYAYSPNYMGWSPFGKLKTKSRHARILREFQLNYLPQNITFNTDLTRTYYEYQERDMDNLANTSNIPLVYTSTFLWNRNFSLRWDLTKNLKMNFTSATNAEIQMPHTAVNKHLFPTEYEAWKDSVWRSIKSLGEPLAYRQAFNASYRLPLSTLPWFAWFNADVSYASTYTWTRGFEYEDGSTLGNTIANTRSINANSTLNLETLYNLVPFLKQTNQRFAVARSAQKPAPRKPFEREVQLRADTTTLVVHGLNNKRVKLTAINQEGQRVPVRYKILDSNRIELLTRDSVKLKVNVVVGKDPKEQPFYRTMQSVARVGMMLRNVNVSYTNNYGLTLPGFLPNIGDVFGQRSGGGLAPGLDFAFGLTGDSYIQTAAQRNWLLMNDSISTAATSTSNENLQISATLQPFRDFNIRLNANRSMTRSRNILYMYQGQPITETGNFSMTTITLGNAFSAFGAANNGYANATFGKFVGLLDVFQRRFEQRYAGSVYPAGTPLAGQTFNPTNGTVSRYSADVMIPAFLSAYANGGRSLELFPSLTKLLPNWSVNYSGLSKLSFMKPIFQNFNINHSYRSIYSVGAYSSYASYAEAVGTGLGFVANATTGTPIPSSRYDISAVTINESFSPLIGVDMTFHNNITAKVEYRKNRVLALSMTSYQLTETGSNDFVIGMGYKVNDLKLFGVGALGNKRQRRSRSKKKATETTATTTNTTFNNALTLQLDFSLRDQATVNRDIATLTSTATSGNKALKISFMANYVLSRLMTLGAYYERQTNTPLLTTSAYPTTTQDFGISFKFSLSH